LGDPEHIAEMLKDRRVHVHHDLSDLEFQQALARADILLNYRLEYRGEASRSVLEAMRLGVAVVVRDIGWYSELPDDVVLKAASPSEALDAVVALAHDERRRRALGFRARSYVSAHHSISDYVDGLLDLLELPPGSLGETARQSLLAVPSRHEALTAIAANLDHLRG
jgi:glycosyltransferase involved in cell wall biosynthesis